MKINPKVYKFLNGSVPQWYLNRYGNRTSLLGWDLNLRYNYSNLNLNLNGHRNAGSLDEAYRKNHAYTISPGAVSSDIQSFYNTDGNGMSALDFVDFYNKNALTIRNHWSTNLTYNDRNAGNHNRLFRKMFVSRSDLNQSPGSDYNIGYLEGLTKGGYNIEDIEGSSTWLRRMDLYENEFDINNPDSNRLHLIKLKDGTVATVYKKANGDIALYDPKNPNGAPSKTTTRSYGIGVKQNPDIESKPTFWLLLQGKLKTQGPNILEALRLGINLHNNARVYDTMILSIKPALLQPYTTHRQIVGDEATKLAYYRRGAEGVTRASRAFTSDADRQMAYLMESNRAANELQAQGDLADNQEIRRTSDESNAHSWGNTERRTLVANQNYLAMLDALAKKANLTALKYSADTTDWDNYLMGVQSRAERERLKEEALNDLIFGLWAQDALVNDAEYNAAVTNLQNVIKKHEDAGETDYWNAQDVKDAITARLKALRRAMIRIYRDKLNFDYNNIYVAKSGRKLTLKDDLLYKTAKDVVEHFRKMVRMLDSSRIRSRLKPIKLSSHPKKFLQGGVAPFTIFRPLAMGGENTISTLTGGGNTTSKKSEGKELLDMIKELFKLVEGLPIDVNTLYRDMNNFFKRYEAFGLELTTEDIASMYLSSMAKLSQLKYSLSVFNQAKELATKNEALNELAITRGGKLVLQDKSTGELKEGTMNEWYESDGKLTALTNDLLLNLRALSKDLAFNDNILNIVNNGVGINKVTAQIKALASQIGSSEQEIEGFGKVESGKIKAGIKLLENAPDGVYKINQYSKDLQQLAKLAIEYIYSMLPNNYKVLLEYHSKGRGKDMIAAAIGSTLDYSTKTTISPLTGKAAKNGSGESNGVDGEMTPAMALALGMGDRLNITIADKTTDGLKVSVVNLPLLDSSNNAMAAATLQQVGNGAYAGQLDLGLATMGGVKISNLGINNVLIDRGRIYSAELPIDIREFNSTGIIKPNLDFLRNIEKADAEVRLAGITNRDNLTAEQVLLINNIYNKNGLPIIYTTASNGKPILTSEYRRFAMLHATAPENAFEGDLTFNNGVIEADDDDRTRYEAMMKDITKNNKFSIDNGVGIGSLRFGRTDLYRGMLYIPMSNSTISALASTKFKASPEDYNLIEAADLLAEFIRKSGYLSGGSWNN